MRRITHIVIHCTAGPKNQTIESIKHWWHTHPDGPKWKNVGYHYCVMGDGSIERLAPISQVTNGVRGHNANSVHIAYTGGMREDDRTVEQKAGILLCIREVLKELGYKVIIQGHRDFPNVAKACPNFPAKEEYSWITS